MRNHKLTITLYMDEKIDQKILQDENDRLLNKWTEKLDRYNIKILAHLLKMWRLGQEYRAFDININILTCHWVMIPIYLLMAYQNLTKSSKLCLFLCLSTLSNNEQPSLVTQG